LIAALSEDCDLYAAGFHPESSFGHEFSLNLNELNELKTRFLVIEKMGRHENEVTNKM